MIFEKCNSFEKWYVIVYLSISILFYTLCNDNSCKCQMFKIEVLKNSYWQRLSTAKFLQQKYFILYSKTERSISEGERDISEHKSLL